MAIMFVFLFGLCLGGVYADHMFSKSKMLQNVLKESLVNFDMETNLTETYIDADDGDSDWTIDMDQIPDDDIHHAMINEIVRHMLKDLSMDANGCWCKSYSCGCCYQLDIAIVRFKKIACLTATYLPAAKGVQIVFSIDGKVVIEKTITTRNPPPMCTSIPFVSKAVSACLRFSNLDFDSKVFTGCAALEGKAWGTVVKTINLGCFRIPPRAKDEMHM